MRREPPDYVPRGEHSVFAKVAPGPSSPWVTDSISKPADASIPRARSTESWYSTVVVPPLLDHEAAVAEFEPDPCDAVGPEDPLELRERRRNPLVGDEEHRRRTPDAVEAVRRETETPKVHPEVPARTVAAGVLDHPAREVNADRLEAALGEVRDVPTRPAPGVEHRWPREGPDERLEQVPE